MIGLTLGSRHAIRIARELGGQRFDCDVAFSLVSRARYFPHFARTDQSEDLVRTNVISRLEWGIDPFT